jgi:hypothetical protein
MNKFEEDNKIISFPPEKTADGRQRTLMGLSVHDFYIHSDAISADPQNVEFFNEEDWKTRLEWRKKSLSGRLRQIKNRLDVLRGRDVRGRIYSLQRYRYDLRWKGKL